MVIIQPQTILLERGVWGSSPRIFLLILVQNPAILDNSGGYTRYIWHMSASNTWTFPWNFDVWYPLNTDVNKETNTKIKYNSLVYCIFSKWIHVSPLKFCWLKSKVGTCNNLECVSTQLKAMMIYQLCITTILILLCKCVTQIKYCISNFLAVKTG